MKSRIEQEVYRFFSGRTPVPILLAYSGGADSTALLYLLRCFDVDLHLAHVDHSWREESGREAQVLSDIAEELLLPIYTHKLDPSLLGGNLEEACRDERYKFFEKICHERGIRHVVLGHHADDQAETVIKRLFEGGSLLNLTGMESEVERNGITYLRPLLLIRKSEILSWLEAEDISFFEDPTNLDTSFTRARLRHEIIPWLSSHFGKDVTRSLCQLAGDASLFKNELLSKVQKNLDEVIEGPFGKMVEVESDDPFFLSLLVKKFSEISLTRDQVDKAVNLLLTSAADKQIGDLIIDRGRIFFLNNESPKEWSVEKADSPSTWLDVWRGEYKAAIPDGPYKFVFYDELPSDRQQHFRKKWSNAKVPAFLRQKVPVILCSDGTYHDFL